MFYLKPHFLLATRINNLEQYSDALFGYWSAGTGASLMAQWVKNLPAVQEMRVQSLGGEDPLEKEQLSTPVFWPGEFHGLYSPWGHKESDTTEHSCKLS